MTAPYILAGQPPRPMRGPIFATLDGVAAEWAVHDGQRLPVLPKCEDFVFTPPRFEWPWSRWFRRLVRREIDLALAAERAAGRKFAADMEVWLANLNKDLRGPELFEPAPSRFGDRNDRVPS
ncbi:MAG: hypothetical protein WA047_20460 [Phenylobacterium sp.]|uniref:hypothetical protein n=1 Tax=Phenylobacterium sp. TaxID=1871053 RepID=UPI003BB4ACFA